MSTDAERVEHWRATWHRYQMLAREPGRAATSLFRMQMEHAHDDRPSGDHPNDPYDNVYQAAFFRLDQGFWHASPDLSQLYRGQRNGDWRVIPSLYRDPAASGASLDRLHGIVRGLRAMHPHLDDLQSVALAQHYGSELRVQTWLIDVTFEPRVALFFASHGGRSGDIGTVTCIVRHEWEQFSAGGRNRLGAIRLVDVPEVVRIARQRALFLDTSHPDLFDQYVAHTIWFRQHDGVVFGDELADPPVSERSLYPPDDPLLPKLARLDATANGRPVEAAPASDASAPLDAKEYYAIASSWCAAQDVTLDVYRDGTLRVVCDFHSSLQRERDRVPLTARSLHRLREAVDLICIAQRENRYPSPFEALEWTFSRLPRSDVSWFHGRLAECIDRSDGC